MIDTESNSNKTIEIENSNHKKVLYFLKENGYPLKTLSHYYLYYSKIMLISNLENKKINAKKEIEVVAALFLAMKITGLHPNFNTIYPIFNKTEKTNLKGAKEHIDKLTDFSNDIYDLEIFLFENLNFKTFVPCIFLRLGGVFIKEKIDNKKFYQSCNDIMEILENMFNEKNGYKNVVKVFEDLDFMKEIIYKATSKLK